MTHSGNEGREGPTLTDYGGDLDVPVPVCNGCRHHRVHDFHYFYCRLLGDQAKPDFDAYNGGLARIWREPICDLPARAALQPQGGE